MIVNIEWWSYLRYTVHLGRRSLLRWSPRRPQNPYQRICPKRRPQNHRKCQPSRSINEWFKAQALAGVYQRMIWRNLSGMTWWQPCVKHHRPNFLCWAHRCMIIHANMRAIIHANPVLEKLVCVRSANIFFRARIIEQDGKHALAITLVGMELFLRTFCAVRYQTKWSAFQHSSCMYDHTDMISNTERIFQAASVVSPPVNFNSPLSRRSMTLNYNHLINASDGGQNNCCNSFCISWPILW